MDKYSNDFKTIISYQGHVVTVDMRRIVAINHPKEGNKFFRVYFENFVWNVPIEYHDRLYKLWMGLDDKILV